LPAPLTSNALLLAPLNAPLPKVTVPFKPTRFTFFVPPLDVRPLKTTLTVGVETPVRSSPPPVVFIDIVLIFRVPTFAPWIAVPVVTPQLPILKPESVLLPGAPAKVTQFCPAVVLVSVGAAPAVNNVMLFTTRFTP